MSFTEKSARRTVERLGDHAAGGTSQVSHPLNAGLSLSSVAVRGGGEWLNRAAFDRSGKR